MERPRISIPPDMNDYVLEFISIAFLLTACILTIHFWPQLPERIPVHLNAAGKVDRWGSRNTIWIFPAIAGVIYGGLSIIQRYPHTFNYLKPITRDNAYNAYRLAIQLMRFLKMSCLLLFLIVQWSIIQLAIQAESSANMLLLGLGLLVLFGGIGWYLWKSYRC